jgi:CheY-like chemotaxis protein
MRPAHTTANRPVRPPVSVSRTIVCLPPDTDPKLLPQLATAKLRMHGFTVNGVVPHFPARTRRASKLVDRRHGLTSGGPIRLLDLTAMRRNAQAAAWAQWMLWRQVVADTRPANPFWQFADRHRADPRRYPVARAQVDYAAQPRVLAMTAHNARPDTTVQVPTAALEAFQAGLNTYLSLAVLAVVPADGVATTHGAHGGWLTCTSERLADQLAYLQAANAHIDGLHPNLQLIAMTINR